MHFSPPQHEPWGDRSGKSGPSALLRPALEKHYERNDVLEEAE